MFTGLIEAVTRVTAVDSGASGGSLSVERPAAWDDVVVGESIAVSGACLTVLPGTGARSVLRFDVSPETFRRTTLGELRSGDPVNLERALPVGGRLGGHIVAGHVDATTRLLRLARSGAFWTVTFEVGPAWDRYVVEKGSIALDGVSLTVAAVREGELDVAVIPRTLEATTLGRLRPGARVNVEVDVLAKYVERLVTVR